MMSNPSKRRILVAKWKYSEISNMDVDDDNVSVVQGQSPQTQSGGSVQAYALGTAAFAAPVTFGTTPPATPQNRFPLPAPATVHSSTVPFPTTGPWASVSLNPVTTAAGFMSQSEGAMYSQAKRFHGSHHSLQPTMSQPMQYISVPDQHDIHRNVPVNDHQQQQVVSVIGGTQQTGIVAQNPAFGSLPSATSAQSLYSSASSQGSTGNVSSGGSMDLIAFLTQQLQNPLTREEILRCQQMLDDTLMQIKSEVSQESETVDGNYDSKGSCVLSNSGADVQSYIQESCECIEHCEISPTSECYSNVNSVPKSGVKNFFRRLFKSKL